MHGDSKPSGFVKFEDGWKYSKISLLQDWSKLEEINSTDTPQLTLTKMKIDKELSKEQYLQYLDCVIKSTQKQNKIYMDKMKRERRLSRSLLILQRTIQNFDWDKATNEIESFTKYFLTQNLLRLSDGMNMKEIILMTFDLIFKFVHKELLEVFIIFFKQK